MTKYHKLLAQKDALEEKIAEALLAESVEAVDTVRRLIADYGLTAKDCGFSECTPKATVTQIKKRAKAPAKYMSDDGRIWNGHGRAPSWIVQAEFAGRARDEFLIAKDAA